MGLYGAAASILVAWSILLGGISYYKGRDSRNPEIASYQAAIKASEILAAEAEDRAAKASARVVVEYRDKIKTITERIPAEVQLIEVIRETPGLCDLPGAYRLLWDGSAPPGGEEAQSSGGVNAAPVAVADAAEAAAEARRRFDKNAAQLTALQDWVNSQ